MRVDKTADVPVVDISPLAGEDAAAIAEVARSWDAAMSSLGLVAITGHGVPDDVAGQLASASHDFFGFSQQEKMQSCLHRGYGHGGFVPIGVEAVARSTATGADKPPDLVENIVFSHGGDPALEAVMPAQPASLQPAVATYWSAAEKVLRILMRLSALALGLPADFFTPYFAAPKCNLRLAYYPEVTRPISANLTHLAWLN